MRTPSPSSTRASESSATGPHPPHPPRGPAAAAASRGRLTCSRNRPYDGYEEVGRYQPSSIQDEEGGGVGGRSVTRESNLLEDCRTRPVPVVLSCPRIDRDIGSSRRSRPIVRVEPEEGTVDEGGHEAKGDGGDRNGRDELLVFLRVVAVAVAAVVFFADTIHRDRRRGSDSQVRLEGRAERGRVDPSGGRGGSGWRRRIRCSPPPKGGDLLPLSSPSYGTTTSMYHGNCGSEIARVGML